MKELKRLNGFGNFDKFGGYYDADEVDALLAEKDAGRIIGGAIVDCVNTSEELFRNSLELNITDFLVERIGKAKPISFHKQLAHRMAMHNKDAAVPNPKPAKRRGRPARNREDA